MMGSLRFQLCEMSLYPKPKPQFCKSPLKNKCSLMMVKQSPPPPMMMISCGLRGGPRKSIWRSRVLSTEAIQAVQSLKLAKKSSSDTKLEEVLSSRVSRLLKADLLDTLTELRRQNELDLALKVFEFVRKEVWYDSNLSVFSDMILLLGKNKLIEMAEQLFSELKKEGLVPDTRAYTELIGAYLQVGMIQKAMETYHLMKESGCVPDKLTLTILIRNLEKAGEEELAASVKKEADEYVDSPKKFLEEIQTKYPKRRSLNLV
ncbi:pentatricopeptide repeat-containing protein At1g62350-like isoform X2 [Cornus florida]|uniref:pentatricopeptide repeat-containing protein At1g62350-like isoform X2 n=1 Tax=Cornus florida TaxID=4283 RepID=UPI00289BF2F4|nr:pentatricopeptide repeat-containing protein At1g62350-like isoform X2 [Cornus florida]